MSVNMHTLLQRCSTSGAAALLPRPYSSTRICTCTYENIYVYVYLYLYIFTAALRDERLRCNVAHIVLCVCECVHIYICTRVHTHVYILTHVYQCIHIYM